MRLKYFNIFSEDKFNKKMDEDAVLKFIYSHKNVNLC
jgi:hypothetical protein